MLGALDSCAVTGAVSSTIVITGDRAVDGDAGKRARPGESDAGAAAGCASPSCSNTNTVAPPAISTARTVSISQPAVRLAYLITVGNPPGAANPYTSTPPPGSAAASTRWRNSGGAANAGAVPNIANGASLRCERSQTSHWST